jgi:hypothetical protein
LRGNAVTRANDDLIFFLRNMSTVVHGSTGHVENLNTRVRN